MADSMNSPLALELPLSREALASLRAGDACTLSGAMYTLRDAGHMRLLDELHERGRLPYDLEGATIFYAADASCSRSTLWCGWSYHGIAHGFRCS